MLYALVKKSDIIRDVLNLYHHCDMKSLTTFIFSFFFVHTILCAQKPTVDFTADVVAGCAPLTVTFSDKSSIDVIDWQWDVDGNGVVDYTADPEPVHTYLTPGLYTVKLTVSNFVDSAVMTKVRYIRVTAPPSITVPTATTCAGDTVRVRANIIGGVRPFTYFWSALNFPFVSTDSVPAFAPDTTRLWTLTLTDSVGCSVETSFTILVRPGPEKPIITRAGFTLTCSTLASRYQWYLNGKIIVGETSRTYRLDTAKLKTGWLFVEVRELNGCSSRSDSLQISTITAVERDDESAWSYFPNPVRDELVIVSLAADALQEVTVVNYLGQPIGTKTPIRRAQNYVVDLHDLPTGVYGLSLRSRSGSRVVTIVKE